MTCLPRWLLSTGLRRNGSSGHCDLTMFTYSVMRFTAATRQGNRAAGGEGTERCGRRGVTSHGADPFLLLNETIHITPTHPKAPPGDGPCLTHLSHLEQTRVSVKPRSRQPVAAAGVASETHASRSSAAARCTCRSRASSARTHTRQIGHAR